MPKRVVTGVNSEGRSYIVSCDDLVYEPQTLGIVWDHDPGESQLGAWIEAITPDRFLDPGIKPGGAMLVRQVWPPTSPSAGPPFWHATKTIDFVVLLEGKLTLLLDEESVEVEQGDVVIQRATHHAWQSDGDERVVILTVGLAPA